MGAISSYAGKSSPMVGEQPSVVREAVDAGRRQWRQTFGGVSKEDGNGREFPKVRSDSYGRSVVAEPAATKRLLQAMRSMAPGGWSDDRWEMSRHFVSIAYVAIHRQNELLSQAEFQVFEKDENHPDGKRPITRHSNPDAYRLVQLLEKPNNDDSFGDLMSQINLQMDLTSMALTWMIPSKLPSHVEGSDGKPLGMPMELYVIPTATAIPQPAINPDYPDGYWRIQPLYPYGPFSSYPTPTTAVGAPIPAQWMLRIKYPHPLLRYDGWSPMTALKLHLDEVEMMDRSRHYKMRGSINPSAVLQFDEMEGAEPLPDSEVERIHAEWENNFQGPENHGKFIVGTPGARLEEWGISPREMDYTGSWDQLVSFCLGGLGITKPAAGMIEDTNYSVLFATLKQLYWLTLEPKADRIAKKLTRHLAPFFGDNLIIEITCKRIDDHEITFQQVDRAMGGKAISKNELRKKMDLPLTKEEWGNDMAGDPTPFEIEQMQLEMQMQQQAAMAQAQGGQGPPLQGQEGVVEEGSPQGGEVPQENGEPSLDDVLGLSGGAPPDEMEEERPSPGGLSQGALGGRMASLERHWRKKSLLERVRKVFSNGYH